MRFVSHLVSGPDTPNRQIFRAAVLIGLLTLVAKAVTAIKELFVAPWFGRSDALDAFLIAYLLPSFFVSLTMGALGSAFTPVFVAVRVSKGMEAAQKLFSTVLILSSSALLMLMVLLAVCAPYFLPYLGSVFSEQKLHLARELLYWLLPFVVFGGIAIFAGSVLNAEEKFALAAATPLLTPLVTIIFIELSAQRLGPFSLAAGVVTGSFLEAALLWRALKSHGLRPLRGWGGIDGNTRGVLSQFAPMLAGSFFSCFTNVVDQSMAAMLPAGSVAALNYANKVVVGILAVGATGLSTATLAYFSKMIAQDNWDGCRHTLKRYAVLVAVMTAPLALGIVLFSQPLIRVLFQRGAFTIADTRLISGVQTCYAIQIPFYICATLFVRFLSSIRRNDVLMYWAAVSLVLDIVLNLVFMRILGVAGIALSTSCIYILGCLCLGAFSFRVLAQHRVSASITAETQGAVR